MKKLRKIGHLLQARSDSDGSDATQTNESTDALGADVLYDGTEDPSGGVDIVFVHGLRGSSWKTWSSGSICWPRDLLKHDIQDSRVITWGYDSSVAKVLAYSSVESIYGHAESILIDLSSIRRGVTRPIVFAAHSLGGLVVKEALVKAAAYKNHSRHLDIAEIYVKTRGIIFFGTPHRGSAKASLGEIVAGISKYCLRQPNKQLLQTLKTDSHILENQRDQFVTISQGMHVVCVREVLPTAIGIIVPESSACYDGFNVQRSSVNANHMDMVRFTHRGDSRYIRIVGHLVELTEKTKTSTQDSTTNKAILNKLHFQRLETRELGINPAYEKTFEWITSDEKPGNTGKEPNFIDWLHSEEPLLWISGKAASGKSTLMKYLYKTQSHLIRNIPESSNSSYIIATFFIYERGGNLQKSREGMLRSLLYQILSADKTLIAEAFPGRTFIDLDWESLQWEFSQVLHILERRHTRLFLFLDGLDEYRIIDRIDSYTEEDFDLIYDGENNDAAWGTSRWIVGGHYEIARFVKKLRSNKLVRTCFSSREVPVFENQFRGLPRIKVHNHTRSDIHRFCQGRLSKEAPDLADMESFAKAITTRAAGVFLWVKLVIDMLIDGCINGDTPDELWATLNSVPDRLGGKNGLYMLMIKHILDNHKAESSKIFEIVLNAKNPLHIAHLFKAAEFLCGPRENTSASVAAHQHHTRMSLKEFETHCESKARRLRSRCAGLLEAGPEVQFMHQTAKEFISRQYVWTTIYGSARDSQSCIIPSALVRGSVDFIRLLDVVDLPQSFDSNWIRVNRPLISIQDTMYHLSQVDKRTEDIDAYVRLIKHFDEACRTSKDALTSRFKTGAAAKDEFHSWMPAATAEVFSLWFNVHPPIRYFSPHFSNFNAYATQYDLAKYIEYELWSKSPVERIGLAQNLLASAFSVYNEDGIVSLRANERVVAVILSSGASPNKIMLRYGTRNNLENGGKEYTVWNDLVEAGYRFWPASFIIKYKPKTLFRFRNSAAEDFSIHPLTWRGGIQDLDSNLSGVGTFLEWLRLISLLLEYGARLDSPAGVLIKRVMPPNLDEADDTKLFTTASILELILKRRPRGDLRTEEQDLIEAIREQIQDIMLPLATKFDLSDFE